MIVPGVVVGFKVGRRANTFSIFRLRSSFWTGMFLERESHRSAEAEVGRGLAQAGEDVGFQIPAFGNVVVYT